MQDHALLGTPLKSNTYKAELQVFSFLRQEDAKIWEKCDVLY